MFWKFHYTVRLHDGSAHVYSCNTRLGAPLAITVIVMYGDRSPKTDFNVLPFGSAVQADRSSREDRFVSSQLALVHNLFVADAIKRYLQIGRRSGSSAHGK